MSNTDEYRASVLSALGIEDDVNIRYFADFRKALLTKLGMDFTDEDVRNEERFRLKFLEGISAFSGLSVKTISGAIASFDDAVYDVPLKSLLVNFGYKASGYESVNVNVAGGMIFDPSTQGTMGEAQGVGWWINASDSIIEQGGESNKSFAIPCKPQTKYYFEFDGTTTIFRIGFGKMADLSFVDSSTWAQLYNVRAFNESGKRSWVGESPNGATYLFIQIGSADFMADKLKIKAYEIAESYPISLGQTVYGGTLEVMSGKLISTLASDGTELLVPLEIQLPESQVQIIRSLSGHNNIWADVGSVEVKYLAK